MKLLILSCSERKSSWAEKIPAICLYDGPAYRILRRKVFRGKVLILSAKHGLIDSRRPIEDYNQKMDAARADELRESVRFDLARELKALNPTDVFFYGGKLYRDCVGQEYPVQITFSQGAIGQQLHQLKQWLEDE